MIRSASIDQVGVTGDPFAAQIWHGVKIARSSSSTVSLRRMATSAANLAVSF